MSYNIINKKGNSNFQNVQPGRFPCENESVIQEMFKTTSKNTEELKLLMESCKYNSEKVGEIIKHLKTETARVSRRYDETMDAVDMYFDEVTDTLNTMQRLNDAQLEDIDREITEARKMQLRTHVVCAIAMISSIASIVLTIILEQRKEKIWKLYRKN